MAIPVYIFAGFLESGKTSFIGSVLNDENFVGKTKSLLVMTEEGEMELEDDLLKKARTTMVATEDEENLIQTLRGYVREYQPERIIIEFNGMWDLESFVDNAPSLFEIYEIITTVNAETFEVYIGNMGARMIEHIAAADMLVFNRCEDATKEAIRGRNIKAMNPRAAIYLEDKNGDAEDYSFGMPPPFDLDAPIVEISDEEFGIFYMDAMNMPERYEGKTVRFKGTVYLGKDLDSDMFVPGRMANVCCADDIRFVGFVCKTKEAKKLKKNDWVTVTAKVKVETVRQYRNEGPVLYAETIEPATPPETEVVEFN